MLVFFYVEPLFVLEPFRIVKPLHANFFGRIEKKTELFNSWQFIFLLFVSSATCCNLLCFFEFKGGTILSTNWKRICLEALKQTVVSHCFFLLWISSLFFQLRLRMTAVNPLHLSLLLPWLSWWRLRIYKKPRFDGLIFRTVGVYQKWNVETRILRQDFELLLGRGWYSSALIVKAALSSLTKFELFVHLRLL